MKNVLIWLAALCSFTAIDIKKAGAQTSRPDTASLCHLPPDAFQVVRINLPYLLTKANWLDFSPVIPGLSPSVSGQLAFVDAIRDPKDIGINVRKPVFITNGLNPDSSAYAIIIFWLTDSSRFGPWLQKLYPTLQPSSQNGVRAAGIAQTIFAWDQKLAAVTIGYASRNVLQKSRLILQGFHGSLFTTDTAFTTAFCGNADLEIWAPGTVWLSMPMRFSKKDKRPQRHALASIRFQTGQITIEADVPLTPPEERCVHLFTNRPLPEKWLAPFPKDDLLAFAAWHVDSPALAWRVDSLNASRMFFSLLNANIADLKGAFRGDFMLAATKPDHPGGFSDGKIKYYLIATTRDSIPLSKLAITLKASYASRDSICVIGNRPGSAQEYLDAPARNATTLMTDPLRNYPVGGALDLRSLRSIFPLGPPSGTTNTTLITLLKLTHFSTLNFTIGYTAHTSTARIELHTLDPGYNSLAMLLKDIGP